MSTPIVLNLNNIDFDDSYNTDNGELWQQQAGDMLVKNLLSIGRQAEAYRQRRKKDKNLSPLAMHDAIFISGGRGAGKTVFLKNAQKIWRGSPNAESINLHFTPAIDPTLLIDHDNFTNVVVAHLYNEVEKTFSSSPNPLEIYKTDFYSKLKQLADSLGQESDYEDRVGIDRILKYRSGIQVESFFHDYVEVCIKILNSTAIVIPIDDVDMALNRAYEVLDVVRRILGCPYIIPLISGDDALYQHMINQHFMNDISSNQSKNISVDEDLAFANRLTNAYLTKVLPSHLRIPLLTIDSLLDKLKLKEDGKDDSDFEDYSDSFDDHFYGFVNGEEKSADWPRPSNAREVVQLLTMFPPSDFLAKPILGQWTSLKSWALMKKCGSTLALSTSAMLMVEIKNNFRLHEVMLFNPLKQVEESLGWAKKDFYCEQKKAIEQLKLGSKDDNQIELLEPFKDKKIFNSMPALEFYTRKFSVPSKEVSNTEYSNNILLSIYTYKDYYGSSGSTIHQVFFSRAFEILLISLLSSDFDRSRFQRRRWIRNIRGIQESSPFYSVYQMAPTKFIELEEDDNHIPLSNNDQLVASERLGQLVDDILKWREQHSEILKDFIINNPYALLHSVFNKTFTQLHLLRCKGGVLKEEYLSTLVKRFEYILINAFASFLKPSGIVNANIARTASIDIFKDYESFRRQETVFVRNVEHYIGRKTSDTESGFTNAIHEKYNIEPTSEIKLLRAIWQHPIFSLVEESSVLQYRLQTSSISTAINESTKGKKRPKVIGDALKAAGSSKTDKNSWVNWKNSNPLEFEENVRKISDWLEKSSENKVTVKTLVPAYVEFYKWLKESSDTRLA